MQQPGLFPTESPEEAKKELARPDRVWLVDGHHLAYRSYFAFGAGAEHRLATSRGEPTQAIFGFLRILLGLLKEDGDCVVVVFDAPAKTFRQAAYEDYKAGRAPAPEDFKPQLEKIKRIVDLLGLRRLEVEGYEADDVIGTLAKRAEGEGYPVRILTGDRDSFQLVSERVNVLLPDKRLMTPSAIEEKYGVSVAQWVDYRSLVGDASDNLPGAKGIGEKTAAKLLQEWKTLEGLYENLGKLSPKIRAGLEESRDNVKLSHALSKIETDVPLEVDFLRCHRREPDREALREMLERLEFGSILRELNLLSAPAPAEAADWPPPAEALPQAFVGYVMDRAQPMWASLTGLGAAAGGKVYQAPADLDELRRFPELRALAAKDLAVLALREGLSVVPGDDPLLLAYVYDPSNTEPATTARRYGAGDWSDDPAERAQVAQALWDTVWQRIGGDQRLAKLYNEVEKPLSVVLARMEAKGIALDAPYITGLAEDLNKEVAQIEREIFELAGHSFNLGSRDQLETVLYDELKLGSSGGKKTSTGKRSTAAAVLEAMAADHPIVEKILTYRELTKLKGTYLEPLPKLVHPKTGRLHTRFNQTVAATGRLSSSDPNLQNIPIRTDVGRKIRRGFVAAPGRKLVAADYSQIELRILAHMSGDENLIEVFREKKDVHTQTAAWMFGGRLEDVTVHQRRAAKTINFGVLYGMSAHRLSNELSIPYAEAEGFIQRYFASYPKVREWIDKTLDDGRRLGYVETIFGRKRFVSDLNAKIPTVRQAAERMAFNMPVQGTAADLMKMAMVNLQPELDKLNAHLILQVHDELVIEAEPGAVEQVSEVVCEVMKNVYELVVPLEVGVGSGDNWLDAK